jgi:hypothetical protein
MSHLDSSMSGEESDEPPTEVKRFRHEPRNYNITRRYDRQRPRRSRLASKDALSSHPKGIFIVMKLQIYSNGCRK